ncbi:hypothetical protein FB565_000304 [Actinoplanes lutulentus]|uniref:Uncharacterized protein n=1 Tax=Actinoplanes lutulentus TaxID=1287878 RepID=A0A327ZKW7_9ACTN|nr:hypothetical protein [Actinoplanes lutulentus]MBB2940600.1 hypothetical protein [Actinoplanes lutulentus]RAK42911.1 hypothetical protein B0I29_10141 [Actinoplanes lutulentus]
MSDLWSKDGNLPAPFEHLQTHLTDTAARLNAGLDANLPVIGEKSGELDEAVAQAVFPAAVSVRKTMVGLSEMPGVDEERVNQLRSVLNQQEDAANDQARLGVNNR